MIEKRKTMRRLQRRALQRQHAAAAAAAEAREKELAVQTESKDDAIAAMAREALSAAKRSADELKAKQEADKKALDDRLAADDAALSLSLGVSIVDEPSAADTLIDEYNVQMEPTAASLDSGSNALSMQLMKQMMVEKRKQGAYVLCAVLSVLCGWRLTHSFTQCAHSRDRSLVCTVRRAQQNALKAKQRAALEDANRRAAELKVRADAATAATEANGGDASTANTARRAAIAQMRHVAELETAQLAEEAQLEEGLAREEEQLAMALGLREEPSAADTLQTEHTLIMETSPAASAAADASMAMVRQMVNAQMLKR